MLNNGLRIGQLNCTHTFQNVGSLLPPFQPLGPLRVLTCSAQIRANQLDTLNLFADNLYEATAFTSPSVGSNDKSTTSLRNRELVAGPGSDVAESNQLVLGYVT